MRIAYRRVSGALPLGPNEQISRRLWFEKRWALVRALELRGHQIYWVSRVANNSPGFKQSQIERDCQMLFLEFSSSNPNFYRQDLEDTANLLKNYRGKVIFICDDPDFSIDWKSYGEHQDFSQWRCWYNAIKPQPLYGQPPQIPIDDVPFSSLVDTHPMDLPQAMISNQLIYYGRPGGRAGAIKRILKAKIPLVLAGSVKEWEPFLSRNPMDAKLLEKPQRSRRAAFYAQFLAALALSDAKHKKMGWRTARAYHAILAGTPVIAEHDHPAMSQFAQYDTIARLQEFLAAWRDPGARQTAWERQYNHVQSERPLASAAFARAGL